MPIKFSGISMDNSTRPISPITSGSPLSSTAQTSPSLTTIIPLPVYSSTLLIYNLLSTC